MGGKPWPWSWQWYFWIWQQKLKHWKQKINTWDYIKLKSFCTAKDSTKWAICGTGENICTPLRGWYSPVPGDRQAEGRPRAERSTCEPSYDPISSVTVPRPALCTLPGSCVRGVFLQKYWSGLLFPPPRDLLTQGLNQRLLSLLHCQVDSLSRSHLGIPEVSCRMPAALILLSGFPTGKDWRREEKGAAEDEMVGWHHRLDGHEFEQTPGDSEGQGSLAFCRPRVTESDTTEWLNDHYQVFRRNLSMVSA